MEHFVGLWWEAFVYLDWRYLLLPGSMFLLFYVVMKKDFLTLKVNPKFPSTADYIRDFVLSQIGVAIFAACLVSWGFCFVSSFSQEGFRHVR